MAKKHRIEYLPVAVRDLQSIFDYISGDLSSPQAALLLLDTIDEKVQRLSEFPYSCECARDATLKKKGYRLLVIQNYIVFYVVLKDIVEIRRILYKKSSYQPMLF
jgi:toxin ParE1/3/4